MVARTGIIFFTNANGRQFQYFYRTRARFVFDARRFATREIQMSINGFCVSRFASRVQYTLRISRTIVFNAPKGLRSTLAQDPFCRGALNNTRRPTTPHRHLLVGTLLRGVRALLLLFFQGVVGRVNN